MITLMSVLLFLVNAILFICSAKIKRKEFPDQYDFDHELGLEVVYHPTATLIQFVTLVLAVLSVKLVFEQGFYWNPLFGWITVLFLFIAGLIIFYFFWNFSEDKYEKFQGYLSILHLAIISFLSIIAAYIG